MTGPEPLDGERGDLIERPGRDGGRDVRRLLGAVLLALGLGTVVYYVWRQARPIQPPPPKSTPANGEMRLPRLDTAALPPVADAAVADPGTAATATSAAPTLAPPSTGAALAPLAPTAPSTATAPARLRIPSPVLVAPVAAGPSVPAPVVTPTASVAHPPPVPVATARALPERRFLLPRGSFLDCTLETAIDSTLPGLATCLLASDAYGADGQVVLLARGSRLVGDVHSDVRQGQARVTVVWTEARTPEGVSVPLGAPGTDALGRTGVPGSVDRHTAERFGAALVLSLIETGTNALASRGGGSVVYNVGTSRDVATEALRHSIGIPPSIRVEPGARVEVIVAADVDFHATYALERSDAR